MLKRVYTSLSLLPSVSAVEVIESVPFVSPSVCLSVSQRSSGQTNCTIFEFSTPLKGLCVQQDYGLRTREVHQRWGVFIIEKECLAGINTANPSFGLTSTIRITVYIQFVKTREYNSTVGVTPKESLAGPPFGVTMT